MYISTKVKRNIQLTLFVVGILCTLSRAWDVITSPASGRAWFDFLGIMLLTYLCFNNFRDYDQRLKKEKDQ